MSLEPVIAGELAAVVTSLEMRERPRPAPLPASPLRLIRWPAPGVAAYRTLFSRVGARWLWFSRLLLEDAALSAIIADSAVEVYAAADAAGAEVGLLELDFRTSGQCELAFVGLVPELAGQGHGRWLLAEAIARAWRKEVTRVWVHTCTLDHPAALAAYQRAGFMPFARAIERFADPRKLGVLPEDCAPQVPLL
ncbi:GNAT superfamily N-acetyltransferase [Sphingomonas vulcanisoli]|uniref:GNAT superfamily N-acetyltransferase n=1 Tax=Sphingomonas vulcanisoli TaxID=1658060 RepID=A0ABX0TVJ6_9SPHN|nr:GNAT family N-acetyltransferase [Sphingomonas vulcanisoli]NIJ08385.1 GNAT superfamily N-acetyltransferase [Sphingomonas vulcanisoli]